MSINIGNGTANLTYGLDFQDMRNLTLAGDGDTSTVLLNNISGGESTMAIVLNGLAGGFSASNIANGFHDVVIDASQMLGEISVPVIMVNR